MPAIRADLAAIEDARHCAAVANAVLAAFDHDRLFAARTLVTLAAVLAGHDAVARTVVADAMLECARDLDRDVIAATWQ